MSKGIEGFCRLCGRFGLLTFEHTPPRKAFNNNQIFLRTIEDHVSDRGERTRFRRGLGAYSLCGRCNTRTGAWYGPAFIEWSKQGFAWYERYKGDRLLSLPYSIKPLNVLKQVLVMAIANSTELGISKHSDLRSFLLNPKSREMPSKYTASVHYSMAGLRRHNANMAIMDVAGGGSNYVFAEIVIPPFGYCVTQPIGTNKSLIESKGLFDMMVFSRYAYDEWTRLHLRIPSKETFFPSPLDYRDSSGVE